MKYKITAVITAAVILVVSVFFSLPDYKNTKRVHQHLESPVITECDCDKSQLCTHLPIITIDTAGQEIPGKAVKNELGQTEYTTTASGETRIYARLNAIDNTDSRNHPTDKPSVSSKISMRVRGISSRWFDKSNYYIKLVKEDLSNNPQSMLGMDSHHEWALHGPFLDKTLIRNYMCYNIAGEIMDYAPNVRFCELILNGEYKGVYLLCETITAGTEGARLNLTVDKKDNTFNGYCIRLDRIDDDDTQNITPFTKYTIRTKLQQSIVYPGRANMTDELQTAIKDDFSAFEKSLYSYDFDNKKYGYDEQIDVQSFVDYFIINEFSCNYDAGWLSTYMYKDLDGKFRMCVWDFNSAFDGYQESFMPADHFEMQNCLWYFMLFKDEDFTDRIISRYRELRKTYLSDEYLNNYIDETIAYLGDAIDRNYEVWGYTFGEEYDLFTPADRNPRDYETAVADMKEFIAVRSKYMDENIETLRQYSAESKIKKFNENAN